MEESQIFFFGVPYLATYIFFQLNEPGLDARIDPGMALTTFPSRDENRTHDLLFMEESTYPNSSAIGSFADSNESWKNWQF